MDHKPLYELIAKIPKIQTVQIADRLDLSLEDARAAVQLRIDAGEVKQFNVFSSNGNPAFGYDFTDDYRATAEYRSLFAQVKLPLPADAPKESRSDRAVAFVKAHGKATNEELHAVMGLERYENVSSFLVGSLRSGRLARDANKVWILGPNADVPKHGRIPKPGAPETRQTAAGATAVMVAAPAPVAVRQVEHEPVAATTKDAPQGLPEPVLKELSKPVQTLAAAATLTTGAAPAKFRCGFWSDGVLELQRNGRSVVELTQVERELLRDFMERLRKPCEQLD